MSDQNRAIDAYKQDLCKLKSENLNSISRISFLERKLSVDKHPEYDPIVRNISSQSDKPNRSSTSKPVYTQITPPPPNLLRTFVQQRLLIVANRSPLSLMTRLKSLM